MAERLKIGDITIREVLELSYSEYGVNIDDKSKRDIDILSATLRARQRLIYNKSSHQWEQSGREVRIDFIIKTDPISYDKRDGLPIHRYPVTFIIREFEKGIDSAFRWRTGSFKKPLFPTKKISEAKNEKEKNRRRRENKRIMETNIRNGIQLQFFFDLEEVLYRYKLLFGPNMVTISLRKNKKRKGKDKQLPRVRNPKQIPYFDKHSLWIVENILIQLFATKTGFIINNLFKNESRIF